MSDSLTYLSGVCIFIFSLVLGIFIMYHFFRVYKFINNYETQNQSHAYDLNQFVKKHENDVQEILAYIKIQGKRNINRDTNIDDIQLKVEQNVENITGFNFNDIKTKVDKNASDIDLINIKHWKSNVNKNTSDIENLLKLESTFTSNYQSNLNKINDINQKLNNVLFLVLVDGTTKKLTPGIHNIVNENLHLRKNEDGKSIFRRNFLAVNLKNGYGIKFIASKNITKTLFVMNYNEPIFFQLNTFNIEVFEDFINTYDKFEIFDIAEKMKNKDLTIQFFYSSFFLESWIMKSGENRFDFSELTTLFNKTIRKNVDKLYVYFISGDDIEYAFHFKPGDKNLEDKFNDKLQDKKVELFKITDREL